MKHKVAIFDIDDTVFDFIGLLLTLCNNMWGTNYKKSDFHEWCLPKKIMEVFFKYENWIYTSQRTLPKVKDKINKLREDGYQIFLMTARSEKYKKHTEYNLLLNNIKYDKLFFNKNKSLKINRLAEEYDVQIFADDKASTVNKVKRDTKVPNVYLINMPSNKSCDMVDGVIRIDNIDEIEV